MDLLIFDLDGTLVDSKLDLAHSVNATREHFGLPKLDVATIGQYVGNGAPVLIRRAMGNGASDADVRKALEYFLSHYDQHKLDDTRAYPGIPEALAELEAAGVRMAVLTNKPVRVSTAIIEGLGLARHFARIYGGNSFEQKKPDPVGVNTLLADLGAARERTLMVGDSSVDVRTARNAGVKCCGVTYGFQPESFEGDPPDMMVDRPEELARAVIDERKTRGLINS
ncbi:MAG: HAD family hydrolase [Acidobacteriota bacterium]